MRVPVSTVEGIETAGHGRLAVWTRRIFLTVLLLFVVAGLTSFLGVRTTTTHAEQDGWSVSVKHAAVARAGLDVPWEVTVKHPGGFADNITLVVTGDYFNIFETQGFNPEPSDDTRDGTTRAMTFKAPAGDTFVVAYDAYIQPAAQRGRSGTVAVLVDGQRLASVHFSTTLLP